MNDAYIAGLIDGEGYLALLPSRAKGLKQQSFEPVIKIGMTGTSAKVIASVLKERYGGNIETRVSLTKGGRQTYTYIAKSKKRVLAILEDILPHLIVKLDQAIILKEFCLMGSSHSNYASFSESDIARKALIYYELKRLKEPEPLAETK